jgi:hypothetical protein
MTELLHTASMYYLLYHTGTCCQGVEPVNLKPVHMPQRVPEAKRINGVRCVGVPEPIMPANMPHTMLLCTAPDLTYRYLGSNQDSSPYEGGALPLSYTGM